MTAPEAARWFGPASFREKLTLRRRAPLLRRLREELHPGPGVRILDLGGGTGVTTERFAEGAGEVVVVDPDPRKVARGRAARPALGFVEGVAEHLPFEGGRFDRVVSLMSFHHFRDPARALTEVYRVLAPGGWLTVCDIEPASRRARLFHILHALTSRGTLAFADAEKVDRRAHAAGFARVHRENLGSAYLVTATK
jgi:ubiquinone/menaquinone biosynthesis C-methylase UbiE